MAAVLIPHDGNILTVVAQVVHREVVPTGDFDRVQLNLVILARHHTGYVLDHRPVRGAELGVVDPGAVGDLAAVLCGVKVLVEVVDHAVTVYIADVVVILVPELVLIKVVVIAALIVRERHPVQQFLELLIGDVTVLGCIVIADAG